MLIASYVLLAFFGFIALHGMIKFLVSSLNWLHALLWFFSIIITAFSAGVIWGGLLQQ